MKFKFLPIVLFLVFFSIKKTFSIENKILLFVDNEIITSLDVYNEINYIETLNQNFKNLEKNISIEIAKNSLITEIIKKKIVLEYTNNLKIEKKYLEDPIIKIYNNLGFSDLDEISTYLDKSNINIEKVEEKISLEIFWKEFIYSKFADKVIIDRAEIKKNLENNQNKLINSYLLSELIFESVNRDDFDSKYNKIQSDIRDTGFKNAVLIHSISGSKKNNSGEIGWLSETSINPKILDVVKKLSIGETTEPIIIPGGYLIIKLDDLKKIKEKKGDIENEVNKIVLNKTNEQLNNFSNIYFNKIKKEFIINEK